MAQIIVKAKIGEDDFQKYDGTNATFTRANSTGGTSTLTAVGGGTSTMAGLNIVNLVNGTATTATAGGQTLPATPTGFIIISIGGTARKIPFYNT